MPSLQIPPLRSLIIAQISVIYVISCDHKRYRCREINPQQFFRQHKFHIHLTRWYLFYSKYKYYTL